MQRDSIDPPTKDAGPAATLRDDAEALVNLVLKSISQVVVVIGPRNSGKSEFIRERVLPRLGPSGSVLFFDCSSRIPDQALDAVSQPGVVVILDSFDRFLRIPESIREPRLEALFTGKRIATVVLVAGKHCLADLFNLRKVAPDILEHLFELTELKLATELPRYGPAPDTAPLQWEPSLIESLEDDLAHLAESTVTLPLVAIIDEGFRTGAYDASRGLVGLLEKHLERTLTRLSEEPGFGQSSGEVARAILKEVASSGRRGALSLPGLAERQDVAAEIPALCYRWLVETSGLLKESAGEGLIFQPPQLRIVLDKWLEEDRNACAKAERYLSDGVEGRGKVGTLLPRERFNDIHAQRSLVRTTPEQASFLTLCALRSHPDADPGPVNHWFRRIGDAALEVSTLCEALVDPSARARCRAASMLAGIDEPRVHGHLCHAALEDAAAEVRDQAVESLSIFANKGPIRDVLTRAATEGTGETRIRAIQALRIFRDEECARFLEGIVGSPCEQPVRETAIEALARARSEGAVSALIRIALRDSDKEDRDRAGAALADVGSQDLIEFGLNATLQDWVTGRPVRDRRWWKKLGYWPAATVVLILSLFFHGLPLLLFRRWLAGVAFLAVEVVCFAFFARFLNELGPLIWFLNWCASIAVGAWIARRKEARSGSFYRVLSNALLANTMLSGGLLLHGLGHWITGRKRQAWQSLGIEVLAALAILPTFALENVFNLSIGRTGFDKFAMALLYLYRYGGMALSWLWAVSLLIMDERWGRRGPWLSDPHSRVLRALLKAPESAVVLRRNLDADTLKSGCARMLLGRFGDAVPGTALLLVLEQDIRAGRRSRPEILRCLSRHKDKKGYETVVTETGELFDRLPPAQRNQLFSILVSFPTMASIQCLVERRGTLPQWSRVRLWLARVVRPFLGWPWMARLATLAGALLAVLLIADGIRTSLNPGWPQIKELRRLSRIDYADESRDVTRVACHLAEDYPKICVGELVTVFREVKKEYAPGLASSLGLVVASDSGEDAHHIALAALQEAVLNPKKEESVREAVLQALQDAADRRSSIELVAALKNLFDKLGMPSTTREQLLQMQVYQGRVAAILASIARQSTNAQGPLEQSEAAKDAIAGCADGLGLLLRTSLISDVKASAQEALEASGRDEAVNAIKVFILSDSAPVPSEQLENAGDLARKQLDARVRALEELRAMHTAAAANALMDLKKKTAGLPAEIVKRLRVPFGHEIAVTLDSQARRLQENGNLAEAEKKAREAVGADKDFVDALGTLGSILYQEGKKQESLKQFRGATRIAPRYTWAYYMQARILSDLKDKQSYKEAEETLNKAIQIDPGYRFSYALLRRIYLDQGLDRKAIAELQRFQRRYPDVGEIYAQLGWVYHERIATSDSSAYQLAYEAYQKSLGLLGDGDPERTLDLELDLVECSLTIGRYPEVIERVPGLLARVGPNPDSRMALKLFMLSAQVLQQDDRGALKTLAELENIYNSEFIASNTWSNWVYDGTEFYLGKRVPPSAKIAAVLALVHAVNNKSPSETHNGHPPIIPQELFENVRRALQPVSSGPTA